MSKLMQCVPNFSEGRDLEKIDKIIENFRAIKDVKLLNYSNDEDHNRLVVTLVGEPQALKKAVIKAVGTAIELIDLRNHNGQHPRMGAVDVIPFIPIKEVTIDDAKELAIEVAKEINEMYDMPVFLYEKSASATHRQNLAKLRKGEFEGMAEKIKTAEFNPDFGTELHASAGIVAVGARMPLVAFNVNLATNDLDMANKIAKNVRHLSGGLRYVKGIGIALEERGIVQVSMNLTDFTKTPMHRVFELIKIEASRYGVNVIGSEIIGLLPMAALVNTAEWYLRVEDFSIEQVLERRIME